MTPAVRCTQASPYRVAPRRAANRVRRNDSQEDTQDWDGDARARSTMDAASSESNLWASVDGRRPRPRGLQNHLWESQAPWDWAASLQTSPLKCRSCSRASSKWRMGETTLSFDQPRYGFGVSASRKSLTTQRVPLAAESRDKRSQLNAR